MSNDAKLQKVILGPDWIDLSFGEAAVVAQALYNNVNVFGDPFEMPKLSDLTKWTYQPAAGNPEFVELLEKKYGSRVVVCNGAKQALDAALHAVAKAGTNTVYYDIPFYPANPGLIESTGLTRGEIMDAGVRLITSPNNPDGKNYSNAELIHLSFTGLTIHDAAYYTPVYLPDDQIPIPVGDIQIFSLSKMYGMSGMRIGYAVCHNEKFYKSIVDFMETTTAGVSMPSQTIAMEIERFFIDRPNHYNKFVAQARSAIARNRSLCDQIDADVLTPLRPQSNSMFLWAKAGPALDCNATKVYLLPGELFGAPGYVRLNIAQPTELIEEAVHRLNKHKI